MPAIMRSLSSCFEVTRGVETLEEFDELPAAVAVPDERAAPSASCTRLVSHVPCRAEAAPTANAGAEMAD